MAGLIRLVSRRPAGRGLEGAGGLCHVSAHAGCSARACPLMGRRAPGPSFPRLTAPETERRVLMFEEPGALSVLPLRDIVVFPHMISSAVRRGARRSMRALEDVMKDDKLVLLVTQKNAPRTTRPPRTSSASAPSARCATAETSRRHGQGAGRRRPPRHHRPLQRERGLLPGLCRADRRAGRRAAGAGGAVARGGLAVRAVHQAQQEDRPGSWSRSARSRPVAADTVASIWR